MEVVRLKKENYDELIALFDAVFGREKGGLKETEKDLPKMCVPDDEHMGMHFGIFDEGKLRAALGVYPLPMNVCGIPLLFTTVGNVVTHWDYEGRGCMRAMMQQAMRELDRIGADGARLGGLRQRYNNYGFEACGTLYHFTFTPRNRRLTMPDFHSDITFKKILRDDYDSLKYVTELHAREEAAVVRTADDHYREMYTAMTAWQNVPFLACLGDGTPIGYLCLKPDNKVAEMAAETDDLLIEMLAKWTENSGVHLTFVLPPYKVNLIRRFSAICEDMSLSSPNHYLIRNWQKVTDAFLKLKASYANLPHGEMCIGIEGYGTLRLFVSETGAGCERTDASPEITLSPLYAARFLFGPFDPLYAGEANPLAQAWLPLPLSWNLQDRV